MIQLIKLVTTQSFPRYFQNRFFQDPKFYFYINGFLSPSKVQPMCYGMKSFLRIYIVLTSPFNQNIDQCISLQLAVSLWSVWIRHVSLNVWRPTLCERIPPCTFVLPQLFHPFYCPRSNPPTENGASRSTVHCSVTSHSLHCLAVCIYQILL